MRYRALDTNLLVVLDLLLDSRNVTRTGESLGLSQPAISSALARLRCHFDDELLAQIGRANVLTPLAERLRTPLKDLLARTDALISTRAGFDPTKDARRFSLICSDYVTACFGQDVSRYTALSGPRLTVELESMRPESFDRFERAEIDMVIVPKQVTFADHPSMMLFEEHFVCAVWDGHPTIKDSLSVQQYLDARHIVYNSRHGLRQTILDQWFIKESDLTRDIAIRVPSFTDILEVLPGTDFIATVQRRLALKLAKRLPIKIIAAPLDFPVMPMIMQWHRHLNDDDGSRWFREKVRVIVDGALD